MTEEEIILEQSFEIPTIPVKPGGGEEECPACLEQFNQVYKQVHLHHILYSSLPDPDLPGSEIIWSHGSGFEIIEFGSRGGSHPFFTQNYEISF